MRDNLLGYLLGALDAAEYAEVEMALERHPHLRDELQLLRRRLEPLDAIPADHEPPAGLASRTCLCVSQQARSGTPKLSSKFVTLAPSSRAGTPSDPLKVHDRPVSPRGQQSPRGRFSPRGKLSDVVEACGGRAIRWGISDAAVAAGVFLAASLMFFPAIAGSRNAARNATCQNNLRILGIQLAMFSQRDIQGRFPRIPTMGNESFAGMYAVALRENELLPDERVLICPASPWAERMQRFRVPTRDEIRRASGLQLAVLQRMASGSYGGSLGVIENGLHVAPKDKHRPNFALITDTPLGNHPRSGLSRPGGAGKPESCAQNLLFEDGHVAHVVGCLEENFLDNPLLNLNGRPEAGVTADDAVIGSSETAPFIRPPNFTTGRNAAPVSLVPCSN
jgi:hypothetical protein